jgi:hypothetical protein
MFIYRLLILQGPTPSGETLSNPRTKDAGPAGRYAIFCILAFQGGLDSHVSSSVLCSKPAFVVITVQFVLIFLIVRCVRLKNIFLLSSSMIHYAFDVLSAKDLWMVPSTVWRLCAAELHIDWCRILTFLTEYVPSFYLQLYVCRSHAGWLPGRWCSKWWA